MFRLATLGDLEYHPEFPRPFFRGRVPGGGYLKGVVGAESFRVFFPRPPDAAELRAFGEAVEAVLAPDRSASAMVLSRLKKIPKSAGTPI